MFRQQTDPTRRMAARPPSCARRRALPGCNSLSVPMLRLVKLADPTVKNRSSTSKTFEWM
jgi:hypothetical protein